MKPHLPLRVVRASLATVAALSLGLTALPQSAFADSPPAESVEVRLKRLEGELRAVQRKVFPEGAGRTFAPEIAPADNGGNGGPAPAPAASASMVNDLAMRIDAVEAQLKALTASTEQEQDKIAKLDERVTALETKPAAAPVPPPVDPAAVAPAAPADAKAGKAAGKGAPTAPPAPNVAPIAAPSPERQAAVAAIQKPSSEDPAEDTYTYGYRLWEAKFYPEAEQVLAAFVQQYPSHKRLSYARNLLGRTYLDDNKPGAAAQWFLQNYKADPQGDRAADSLLFLGVAMNRLKETKRACVALAEFRQTYADQLNGRLKTPYDALNKSVTCN